MKYLFLSIFDNNWNSYKDKSKLIFQKFNSENLSFTKKIITVYRQHYISHNTTNHQSKTNTNLEENPLALDPITRYKIRIKPNLTPPPTPKITPH